MHAVYGLLHLDHEIPPIYHAATHPAVALKMLKKALV